MKPVAGKEPLLGTCFLLLKFLRRSEGRRIMASYRSYVSSQSPCVDLAIELDLVIRRSLTRRNDEERNNVKIIEESITKPFRKIFALCGVSAYEHLFIRFWRRFVGNILCKRVESYAIFCL